MALIPIKITRTSRPPLGTPIDWSNPLSRGLVEAWAFNEGSGAPFTLNKPPVSGTVGWEPRGITSTDAYYQAPSPDLTDAVTVISAVTRTKNIDFVAVSFVNRGGYQAQNNPYGLHLRYNYGSYRLEQFRWVSGAYTHKHTQEAGVSALFPIGKQTVVAIASAGRSPAVPSLYIDGIPSATAMVYSAPSANANTDLGQIQVSTTSAFVFSSQLLYNRVLQPSEIASLSANPWQIYEPEIVWVEVGGSTLPQIITFGALSSKAYGAAPIALTATASSGLPVSYTSSNTAVATVAGSTVTIVGVGSTNITASQAGDGTYAAATPVVQALTVAKADQTISISAPRYKLPTDPPFAVTATASSGLACTLSILSGPATIAWVNG